MPKSKKDLDKEANEFLKKYDEPIELVLRRLEQDKHSLEGTQRHINELSEIVLKFMNQYNYTNYEDEDDCCDDIERVVDALDIQLTSGQLNYLESCVGPQLMKKSKLQQQVKQENSTCFALISATHKEYLKKHRQDTVP